MNNIEFQRRNVAFKKGTICVEIHPYPYQNIRLYPWHWHDYYELNIFWEGECRERANNQTHNMKKGSLSLVTPIGCHEMEIDENTLIYNIQFFDTDLPQYLKDDLGKIPGYCYAHLDPQQFEEFSSVLNILQSEYEKNDPVYYKSMQCLLEWLLIKLLQNQKTDINKPINDERLISMVNYIHHNFKEKLSLKNLAKRFGYSSVYLGSLFKEKMGTSVNTYIRDTRLNFAYSLLIDSNLTIENISEQAGFCDATYFCTNFKQKYNMTPSQCREQNSTASKKRVED